MIAIFDAAYGEGRAAGACVLAAEWQAAGAQAEYVATRDEIAPYQPGEFYKRELPLILAVLPAAFDYAIVDGYAWLGPDRSPGLGAHLHEALGGRVPVIGVAKTKYLDTPAAEVLRAESNRPLFVTAIGVDLDLAAEWVKGMHGSGRLPTLIKRADGLARSALADCAC